MKPSEKLARMFHDLYEELAPKYGYETRDDTKIFDADSPNGKLMIEVCHEMFIRQLGESYLLSKSKGKTKT